MSVGGIPIRTAGEKRACLFNSQSLLSPRANFINFIVITMKVFCVSFCMQHWRENYLIDFHQINIIISLIN